jgi:hypothetical protein
VTTIRRVALLVAYTATLLLCSCGGQTVAAPLPAVSTTPGQDYCRAAANAAGDAIGALDLIAAHHPGADIDDAMAKQKTYETLMRACDPARYAG